MVGSNLRLSHWRVAMCHFREHLCALHLEVRVVLHGLLEVSYDQMMW